ncbi:hypothetical protein BKA62DRAFT_625186 [Auriculariales sp. MPI-PUGE-AT-0066]|nr:hypothetical protein BKA62DRAFT_625186 [Auriculariales sp. MPI-PUGE-AT-0066]
MSEEHKILGYRPPHGSLAAEAQKAAAKHPDAPGALNGNVSELKRLAADDAARVEAARGNPPPANAAYREVDLDGGLTGIGQVEASKLMSAEHKALGYRPPPDSLAAQAQRAAAQHPNTKSNIDPNILADAAIKDAARIAATRGATANVDMDNVTQQEASPTQSIVQKMYVLNRLLSHGFLSSWPIVVAIAGRFLEWCSSFATSSHFDHA